MSRFGRNIRKFSTKATQFQQALQSAPQKLQQLRENVALTAEQLQQLRNEVQNGLRGLLVSPDQLGQASSEINEGQAVLDKAGYELTGVEIEYGPAQRIIVRLEEFEDVPQAALRRLLLENQSPRTVTALLSAIIKAKDVSGKIQFSNLPYAGVVVHLGAAAAVRVCWGVETAQEETATNIELGTPPPRIQPLKPQSADTPLPNFGSGGFFEARTVSLPFAPSPANQGTPTLPAATVTLPAPSIPTVHTSAPPAEAPSSTDWRRDALERFKKMPGVSKYAR